MGSNLGARTLLTAKKYDLAINLYDLLEELTDQNIFSSDLRLCDMFEDSGRDYDALKHYIKCSEDGQIDAEKYGEDDDSTDAENIQAIRRGYDILVELKSIEDQFKATFIVKSIGKSIIFATEVVNHYQDHKKEIKSKKTPYAEILKKWIKAAVKGAIFKVIDDKKQITKRKIKQIVEQILKETKFLRYYRILAAKTAKLKGDYLDEGNQDNERLNKIDQEKIENTVQSIFVAIDLNKFIKVFNELLIDSFNKLVNDGVKIEIERSNLSTENKLENRNELDFFSNLRLLRMSAFRRMRNRKEKRDFIYNFNFPNIEDIEESPQIKQCISIGNALDYYVFNSGTYSDVYEKVIKIKIFGISDQDIARFVRQMLLGNKHLLKNGKKFSHKKIKEISQLIAEITVLIFALEGSRNNSSFIINQMMLDLIEVGKMTWQQAIKDNEMPMAMSGAVPISRVANKYFSEQLPYEYRHPGPTNPKILKIPKIKKLSDNPVLEKEDKIIESWLKAFHKSDKPISNEGLCSIIHDQIIIWYPRIDPQNLASYPEKKIKDKKEGKAKLLEKKGIKQPPESKSGQGQLKIHPILGDGNCMYNAVLEGIKKLPNYNGNRDVTLQQLRQDIANEINQNMGNYFDLLVTQIFTAIRDQDLVRLSQNQITPHS